MRIHNLQQVINALRRESDTISQEDVDESNHKATEEQKEICQKLKEYLQNANVRVRLPKLKAIPKKNFKEQIRIVEAVMVTMKMADISKTTGAGVCRCKACDRKTEC